MHVLNPYTSNGINTPARSRYSTFMFSGVNLASGGAPLEYGEALSAVLPLETKDHSDINKLGMNFSSVGLGGGGTGTFDKGSLSVDLNYQNLKYYDKVYSGRLDFEKPYRLFAGAAQFRYAPGSATLLKSMRNTTGRISLLTKEASAACSGWARTMFMSMLPCAIVQLPNGTGLRELLFPIMRRK